MKFSAITTFNLCAAVASVADSSFNLASLISAYYPKLYPEDQPQPINLFNSLAWTSAENAIYSAAPSSAKSSIDKSGYYYDQITSWAWYTKSVPGSVQTAVTKEISTIDSTTLKVFATITSTSAAALTRTAAPIMDAVVAVVGGILATI